MHKRLENLTADDGVETLVRQRQRQCARIGQRKQRCVAVTPEFLVLATRREQIGKAQINTQNISAIVQMQGHGVASLAAAQVEHALPGAQGKVAAINGLHGTAPDGNRRSCRGHTHPS